MDISDIVSTEYERFDVGTPVSKVAGAFEDPDLKAVVVTDGGDYEGVVTRRQLASSHEQPNQKVGSVVWHVPRVERHEDVREVARLMVGSDAKVLPVVEDGTVHGVVHADDLLAAVREFLDVLSVRHVYSDDLVTVDPDTTLGEVLNVLREHRITHLPVVEDDDLRGIVSLYDVIGFTTRDVERSQGGDFGDPRAESGGRTHGGYGAREGEQARLLDLPVRDVMTEPVGTVRPDQSLDEAVAEMFDIEASSLVAVDDDGTPKGIVTKTDVLRSLTWTAEGRMGVQLFGADLLDDMTYDGVSELIADVARKYADMEVLEAKVHLQEHDEELRGVPLILARIRLYTDKGTFMASDEGFGAKHALHLARNALERQILEGKEYGRSKKHPDPDVWEKVYGWWLTG